MNKNKKLMMTLAVELKNTKEFRPWKRNPAYACSSDGDIYHVNKKGEVSRLNPLKHRPGKSHQIYEYVNVQSLDNGKFHGFPVHRIIFETWGPQEPKDGKRHVVAHKNFNSLDNRLENLKWQTWSQNLKSQDAVLNTRMTHIFNSRREGKVIAVSPSGDETVFFSVFEAGKTLGIEPGWINNILKGNGRTAKGFTFRRAS